MLGKDIAGEFVW